MIFSIISGALKALYTHNFIQEVRCDMGLMSFLFWIDLVCSVCTESARW